MRHGLYSNAKHDCSSYLSAQLCRPVTLRLSLVVVTIPHSTVFEGRRYRREFRTSLILTISLYLTSTLHTILLARNIFLRTMLGEGVGEYSESS